MTVIVSPALYEDMMAESAERGPRVEEQVRKMIIRHARLAKRRKSTRRTARRTVPPTEK